MLLHTSEGCNLIANVHPWINFVVVCWWSDEFNLSHFQRGTTTWKQQGALRNSHTHTHLRESTTLSLSHKRPFSCE